MSRPLTSSPSSSSSSHPDDPAGQAASDVPGAKALAWAVVGLAALRKRKDRSTARQARVDPFRPRPLRPTGPGTNGQAVAVASPGSTGLGSELAGQHAAGGTVPANRFGVSPARYR